MGSSSGLIIAFVVAVWAAYFVPLVLRRYDEAGKNASVHEAGSTGRVITPASATPSGGTATQASAPPSPTRTIDRPAAGLAARRRRRTLLTLLALAVVVTGLATASILPWLAVTVPAVLIVAWLVACRVQVRGELGLTHSAAPAAPVGRHFADEEDTVVVSGQVEDVDPGRVHTMEDVALEVDALDDKIVIAVPSVSTSGEALWDPLPVTLPTYVTKPRAGRTVRTIDFTQPGTWTSGHVEATEDDLPQRREAPPEAEERRAVGS